MKDWRLSITRSRKEVWLGARVGVYELLAFEGLKVMGGWFYLLQIFVGLDVFANIRIQLIVLTLDHLSHQSNRCRWVSLSNQAVP